MHYRLVLGLLVKGIVFSVTAFIGVIMLVGIAVANASVCGLFETAACSGMERTAALLETGPGQTETDFDDGHGYHPGDDPHGPGMGEGSEMNAPLAIVVIGGLIATTFVTLFLVPVFYSILDDWVKKLNKKTPQELSSGKNFLAN
jgi:HAE1 family hydrophobic/amphiphilic exporter-1